MLAANELGRIRRDFQFSLSQARDTKKKKKKKKICHALEEEKATSHMRSRVE
jgi:hypothetical protein